jgi:Dolichyl-phosphate-mannose-protein mannosyltransferase
MISMIGRKTLARNRPSMFHRRLPHPLCAIILLAVLLRAAVMVRGPGPFDDPDNYLPLARSLAAGSGFSLNGHPTAYRPPLYPLMLAPLISMLGGRAVWGIALLHLGLGAGTVWLTAIAAKGSGLSGKRALIASFLVACDPVLISQSRSVMTETPTAFLVAATLAALPVRGWLGPVLGGLGFGLAALCRPSVLAATVLVILAAFLGKPGSLANRLLRGGLLVLTIGIVLSPWAIRNMFIFGEPIFTTTHSGYTLALANKSVYYRDVLNGPRGRVWSGHDQWLWWDEVNRATAGMSEPQADRYLRATVWELVRECPVDFARASLARLERFWGLAPAASVYSGPIRWATVAWTIPFWIALLLGLVQAELWRWPRIAAPLVVAGLTVVHSVFWTDLRMRAPIIPAIALISAGAAWPGIVRSRPARPGSEADQVRLEGSPIG